jgi:hypothetical protein
MPGGKHGLAVKSLAPHAYESPKSRLLYKSESLLFRAVEITMLKEKLTLDSFIKDRFGQQVDVFLQSGIKLAAVTVVGHDTDAIFLRSASDPATTFATLWSAISTVAARDSEASRPDGRRK